MNMIACAMDSTAMQQMVRPATSVPKTTAIWGPAVVPAPWLCHIRRTLGAQAFFIPSTATSRMGKPHTLWLPLSTKTSATMPKGMVSPSQTQTPPPITTCRPIPHITISLQPTTICTTLMGSTTGPSLDDGVAYGLPSGAATGKSSLLNMTEDVNNSRIRLFLLLFSFPRFIHIYIYRE